MTRAVDIEDIVRAVLRQLQGDAPAAATQIANATTAERTLELRTLELSTLELADKLVTLATLEHRLTGVNRLALRAGTVVTPSAQDELRARGITVVRSAAPTQNQPPKPTLVLGVADGAEQACDAPALIAAIAATGCTVERIAQTGLNTIAAELAEHAALGGRPALLLTSRPAAAVCLANRRRGVRAIGGNDARYLREAMADVAANFVAVDPARLTPFELRRLVGEFCTSWPRTSKQEIE
jgi:hypothetical protein